MDKKTRILLFSGGLDSFILYHYLGKPTPLYFNLGHRYAFKEIKIIGDMVKNKLIDDVEWDFSYTLTEWELPDAHIPFRNILLAMGASRYGDTVYLGGVTDDRVSDNTRASHADMTAIISRYAGRFVEVRAPFAELNYSKFDAVKWFLKKYKRTGQAESSLLSTLSCFSPKEGRCMGCKACFRWYVALTWCGVKNVPQWRNAGLVKDYLDQVDEGKIVGERARAIRSIFTDEGD